MKILSVNLTSVIITALGFLFMASTLSDAVSVKARMIPIYKPENLGGNGWKWLYIGIYA